MPRTVLGCAAPKWRKFPAVAALYVYTYVGCGKEYSNPIEAMPPDAYCGGNRAGPLEYYTSV